MIKLSEKISQIPASDTLKINSRVKLLRSQGEHIIDFGVGEPDFDTPNYIKRAGIKAIKEGYTKYSPAAGYPDLINAIIYKLKRDNNLDYSQNNVLVSCGAKHTLTNVMQTILNKDDEVLIPSPYWLSYPEQVKLTGAKPVFVNCEKDQIEIEELNNKLTDKTKLLILNTPNNPTGAVIEKEKLKQISEFCIKNNILVISDEVYEKFIYEKEHISIASLGEEIKNLTITVNSISKTYSMTGWRIGYCAGPEYIIKAATNLQSHTTSAPSSVSQKAAVVALSDPEKFLKNKIRGYKKKRNYILKILNKIANIKYIKPDGAFYIFPDISSFFNREVDSSVTFAEKLLEKTKVAVIPGRSFGNNKNIRISYSSPMKDIEEGMRRIEEYLKL